MRWSAPTILLSVLAVSHGAVARFTSSDLADFSDQAWKEKPIAKVVSLLKKIQAELTAEGDRDGEVFDKMDCWCETNGKAKQKAIADADQRITDLTTAIEEFAAKGKQLRNDIDALSNEIVEGEDALKTATSIRGKESAEFQVEHNDTIVTIASLNDAVTVLDKQQAFPQEMMLQIQQALKQLGPRAFFSTEKNRFKSFLQQETKLGVKGLSRAPSDQILGVLRGMKESFEKDAKKLSEEDASAQAAYDELKATKSEELTAAKTQVENKKTDLADADEKLAQSKLDQRETQAQLTADQEFLSDLTRRCEKMDEEMAERTKIRNDEIAAVGEALDILTNDDARDAMSKTMSFLQISASSHRTKDARARASTLLQRTAQKTHSAYISAIAMMFKTDVFSRIHSSIDAMCEQLAQESKDEVKHRDWCIAELAKVDRQTTAKNDAKSEVEVRVADLATLSATLTTQLAAAKAEIADIQVQTKQASENRQKQNKDFQMTIADQSATQEILGKAVSRLKSFYSKKAALVQKKTPKKLVLIQKVTGTIQKANARQEPPAGFGEYKPNAGSMSVITMMEHLIEESKQVAKDATVAEQESQTAYETFVTDSNTAIKALQKQITTKEEAQGKASEDQAAAEADLRGTNQNILQLAAYLNEVHSTCDYTLKNFDTRQAARSLEINSLKQAKAILSGADFGL